MAQFWQSVVRPLSLRFQTSAALTVTADVIPDFSSTSNVQQKRRLTVGGIIRIAIGVVAAVPVAVIAIVCFMSVSRRKATDSAVVASTDMNDLAIVEATVVPFVTENASTATGTGL
jgi:hypothetical protein